MKQGRIEEYNLYIFFLSCTRERKKLENLIIIMQICKKLSFEYRTQSHFII